MASMASLASLSVALARTGMRLGVALDDGTAEFLTAVGDVVTTVRLGELHLAQNARSFRGCISLVEWQSVG